MAGSWRRRPAFRRSRARQGRQPRHGTARRRPTLDSSCRARRGDGDEPDVDLREPRVEAARAASTSCSTSGARTGVDESLAPTVETPRIKPAAAQPATTRREVPIEELAWTSANSRRWTNSRISNRSCRSDRRRPTTPSSAGRLRSGRLEDDLLSSTSIMGNDTLMGRCEPEPAWWTSRTHGELPIVEKGTLESPATSSSRTSPSMPSLRHERGRTKLDLARAYIDMGDPKARAASSRSAQGGQPGQRKQAEKLLGGCPSAVPAVVPDAADRSRIEYDGSASRAGSTRRMRAACRVNSSARWPGSPTTK